MNSLKKYLGVALLAAVVAAPVAAKEHPMGPNKVINGMDIASVYLQASKMDKVMGVPQALADMHLELDIHATKDNKNTFQEGWWVPYLTVHYTIKKTNEKTGALEFTQSGYLMPMIAGDGPHYGTNIKLDGAGHYTVTYEIAPPSMNKNVMFGRHVDSLTYAPEWFKPFSASWSFDWDGNKNNI